MKKSELVEKIDEFVSSLGSNNKVTRIDIDPEINLENYNEVRNNRINVTFFLKELE